MKSSAGDKGGRADGRDSVRRMDEVQLMCQKEDIEGHHTCLCIFHFGEEGRLALPAFGMTGLGRMVGGYRTLN